MAVYPVSIVGILSNGQELELSSFASATTITRFSFSVEDTPVSTNLVVRIQDIAGATPNEWIEVTVTPGNVTGANTGTVSIGAGNSPWIRVVTGSSAQHLQGFYEAGSQPAIPSGDDLAGLDEVKDYMKITGSGDDAVIQDLITSVSVAMQEYMRMYVARTSRTSEEYDGDGSDILILRNRPILRDVVTPTITIDGTAVADADLSYRDAQGLVRFRSEVSTGLEMGVWAKGIGNILATYESGFAAVPRDLALACIKQTAYELKLSDVRGGRIGRASETLPDGLTIGYEVTDWVVGVRRVMHRYRQYELGML